MDSMPTKDQAPARMPQRPARRRGPKPPPSALAAQASASLEMAPHATWGGTVAILLSLMVAANNLPDGTSSEVAHVAAVWVGLGLLVSVGFDFALGWRNLIRADLMALAALYFLVFVEFLFDQTSFDRMILADDVKAGVYSSLCGFAGIALGRHVFGGRKPIRIELFQREVKPSHIMLLLYLCFCLGYLNIFMSVNFNVFTLIHEMMSPRFSQPWTRGRLGNLSTLLNEFFLFVYIIPAIAGVVFARSRRYSRFNLFAVSVIFFFTLFYGFSSGTRNVFASFLVTFLIAYGFALGREHVKRLMAVTVAVVLLLLFSTYAMLEFRNMGMRKWLNGAYAEPPKAEESFFVDRNLFVISSLTQVFPDLYPYLGWEVPYMALIRPIPRAFWPGKPEGMSVSVEEALGAEGLTLASSFVGESYLSGGNPAVFIAGLLFGMFTGWWSRLANASNSDFGILVYASGFFATVISMRSIFEFTTAALPTIGAITIGVVLLQKHRNAGPPQEGEGAPGQATGKRP